MISGAGLYRLLGDEARLRLLRVLARERLNVTELTAVLGLAQSGVSRHLGLLKDAGLACEEREAGFVYYHLAPLFGDGRGGAADAHGPAADLAGAPLRALLLEQFDQMKGEAAAREDDARLQEVLRERKESFREHGGGAGQLVPGRSWAAWARAVGLLVPPLVVADLGCGEGYLTVEMARWAERVFAVDRSRDVLRRARDLARRRRARNVVWKHGAFEQVPIPDGHVDLAVLSQALHHAESPARALCEAVRIVKPGGRVLVLDLRTHDQAWVKTRLDDQWLGFEDDDLAALLREAGLGGVSVRVGARRTGDPFTVLIALGTKKTADGRARPEKRAGAA